MIALRPLVCPILVGRDELLALAERRIAEVVAGEGRFLLLAGESGMGKTRLLGAIERAAIRGGMRAVRGGTYPSDLRVAGAVLLDLGRSMVRAADASTAADGTTLLSVLDALATSPPDASVATGVAILAAATPRPAKGDAHRRRRLLILDAVDALVDLAAREPTLIQLEDLHWSDDLTLDILEALADRIRDRPVLVVGTYRSDELYPRSPIRAWRSRLVARRTAEEIRLERLDPGQTATMAAVLMASDLPVPRDVVEAIQQRSDGIPLHVEELLGLMAATDRLGPDMAGALVDRGEVPDTVEDAIVARLGTRSAAAVEVARAGAVIGRSFDLDLLSAVLDRPIAELADPISELADHFILLPARMPGRFAFRHALICDSVYAQVPLAERRRSHGRTADAARTRSDFGGAPFLALHLERAGRGAEAYLVAMTGARAASALSSHHDARDLFEMALRTAPADLRPAERAALLEASAIEAAVTDENAAADVRFTEARATYLAGDRPIEAAAVLARHAAVRHLLGDDLETRAASLMRGLDELRPHLAAAEPTERRAADRARTAILAALSAAHMLARRLDESIAFGTVAHHAAEDAGDAAASRNVATTLGACYVFAGQMDEGWSLVEAVIEGAVAGHQEVEAARAYRMLGSCASVLVEYERAERSLRAGIDYAETAQLWNDRHYMAAHLAHVLWATGRWDAADDIARHALADGRGGITTRITALHVLGFVALGRRRLDEAHGFLDEARELGTRMAELQRLSPALWGLAEVALAEGDPATAVELAEEAARASAAVRDAAYLHPFAVTGTRAWLTLGEAAKARAWLERVSEPIEHRAIPGTLPALDHARGLVALTEGTTGIARTHLLAAVAGWSERHRAWEGAWARLDLARCQQRANQRAEAVRLAGTARAIGEDLGAPALVEATDELLGPRSRRHAPTDAWAPLTAREFDVARAVARGRTNPEIAEALGISRKTVAAHVEHILAKLGMGRRAEIAAWVARRPVVDSRPHGGDREE